MHIKMRPHLKTLDRKTFIHKDEMALLQDDRKIPVLNCRGGMRHFGLPSKIGEFIMSNDWTATVQFPGDTRYQCLREELCRYWSDAAALKPDDIKIGHGSMQVLERINKMFIERGVNVLGIAPQFIEYVTEVIMGGADYTGVELDPQENFRFDTEKLLGAIDSRYALIYIDNPNNPTGQLIPLSDLEKIVKEARRRDVVVLIDEAYADYAEKKTSAINLIGRYPNLIVTRTFDKGYQFAGIRVGYGIFPPELGAAYDKIDLPFSIPAVGALLAKEALLDEGFIRNVREQVRSVKVELLKGLREKGYLVSETFETCPIFLLSHTDKDCDLKRYLLSRGIWTVSGEDFMNLGKNYVRVATPARAEDFLKRLA